jgi:hypothetical protein
MTTSCFKPVVSGSCPMNRSLPPAIHPAVAAANCALQDQLVDEMLGGFQLGLPDFREFTGSVAIPAVLRLGNPSWGNYGRNP